MTSVHQGRGVCPQCFRPLPIEVHLDMDARARICRHVTAYCETCKADKGRRHMTSEEAAELLRQLKHHRKADA
jgi:hypothetical protein